MKEKDFDIPTHIIDIYQKKYQLYPSITQIPSITLEGVNLLIKKNTKLWYERIKYENLNIEMSGLLDYGDLLIYYIKNKNESVYRVFILSNLEKEDKINFLYVGLKKFFTIN